MNLARAKAISGDSKGALTSLDETSPAATKVGSGIGSCGAPPACAAVNWNAPPATSSGSARLRQTQRFRSSWRAISRWRRSAIARRLHSMKKLTRTTRIAISRWRGSPRQKVRVASQPEKVLTDWIARHPEDVDTLSSGGGVEAQCG